MKRLLILGSVGFWLVCMGLVFAPQVAGQGTLSEQVLRLLGRANVWTNTNLFNASTTVPLLRLERTSTPAATPTDGFENRGGNLYFNGTLLASAAASGTVTSVGLSLPAIFTVSGSPVVSSGTLTGTLATQTANRVWAGPTTGSAAAPTFRALVAADIPDISATYLTPTSTASLTNKSGNISQWTNDSGYITSVGTGGTGIVTVGTVTTGTWNATVIAGQYGGTGVANTGRTVTLSGNLTTTGAFNPTFAIPSSSTWTFPSGGGTLVLTTVTTLSSLVSVGTITTGVWNGTAIDVARGGTNITSYAVGDILYASGATTLAKLADVATGNALISGGVTTAPAWGKIGLTTHVSGTLPVANGGLGITTVASNGQIPIGNGAGYTAATITGTASQITVTNGGGSITLSTPQNIATASTPQFARLGLGTGAGASALLTGAGQFDLGFTDNGNCGAADTINWNSGETQKSTLSAATCTYTFSNPIAGRYYTLMVIQDATGSRLVTWPTVTWKAGSTPTLTTTANKTDICTFYYTGSAYLGECSLNF